jgi:beta-lactamase class A
MSIRVPRRPPVPSLRSPSELRERFGELEALSGARSLAVAISDFPSGLEFDHHGDRWFHAASTIKLAVLVGVYGAIHRGDLLPQSRVHVRNRFISAHDGSPYRVRVDRDANGEVHREIGRTLRVSELAEHMIASSSNLATNLLLDLVGLDVVQRALEEYGLEGIDLRRGGRGRGRIRSRDQQPGHGAWARRTSAAHRRGAGVQLGALAADAGHPPSPAVPERHPGGLPRGARVANKTGDISTVAHDAGLVYLPDRKPYAIAVLTEWEPSATGRSTTIAAASYLGYAALVGDRVDDD